MHSFGIVLRDNSDVFFESDHGRYLFLFENLLKETADKVGIKCPKDFDGFIEAEEIADREAPDASAQEWLSIYSEAQQRIQPKWFSTQHAIPDFLTLKKEIENQYRLSDDDEDLEYLIESLEVLIEALQQAETKNTEFMLCLM